MTIVTETIGVRRRSSMRRTKSAFSMVYRASSSRRILSGGTPCASAHSAMNAASVFPEQSDLWYTALVELDLPRVAACLYTGISDLPFLRRAWAQLHAAGGTHFMLLARDALADLFPIHCDWLAHLAVLVLHAAWHGIGAWHRDTFPTIQFPEATDLVFSV